MLLVSKNETRGQLGVVPVFRASSKVDGRAGVETGGKVLTEATRWYHLGLPPHHLPVSSCTLLPLAQPTPAIPASSMFFDHTRHAPTTGPQPLMFNLHSALLQRAKAPVLTSFPSLLLIEAIIDDPNEKSHSLDFPDGPVVKILPRGLQEPVCV